MVDARLVEQQPGSWTAEAEDEDGWVNGLDG